MEAAFLRTFPVCGVSGHFADPLPEGLAPVLARLSTGLASSLVGEGSGSCQRKMLFEIPQLKHFALRHLVLRQSHGFLLLLGEPGHEALLGRLQRRLLLLLLLRRLLLLGCPRRGRRVRGRPRVAVGV